MAQFETRNYQCIYCIDRFSSREECKAHPCYAVKNEKEDTMWSTDMTKLLISLYKEHKRKFHLVNIYRRAVSSFCKFYKQKGIIIRVNVPVMNSPTRLFGFKKNN